MAATRRAILRVGGAAIAIAAAGAAGWALTRAPSRARAPWRQASAGFGDPRLDALAFAILAPNPHNMQPWRIELEGDDGFRLYAIAERLLPQTDPLARQITIGFGAFLELFQLAAAEKSRRAIVTLFPDGEPQPMLDARPIAHVRLAPEGNAPRNPLFAVAEERRTVRAPFAPDRDVDRPTLDLIAGASVPGVAAMMISDAPSVEMLRDVAAEAWRIEWTLDRTRRESIGVTRIGRSEIEATPWGLAFEGPMLEGLSLAGVLTRAALDDPQSLAYEQGLKTYDAAIATSRAFAVTSTAANTRVDQIEAGRAWVRMHLAATSAGVAFHPLSQALQEFPEMSGPYRRVHQMLAPEGGTIQMLARLGYAPPPPAAPREALEVKLSEG